MRKPNYARDALTLFCGRRDYASMAKRPHFIRQWRKYRDLTQVQLAERIGMDQGHLSKIERLERPYTQEFLEAAAEALRCEPGDLLMRDPTKHDAAWSLLEALSPPERKRAVALIEALKATGTDG